MKKFNDDSIVKNRAKKDGYYVIGVCDQDNYCNSELSVCIKDDHKVEHAGFLIFGKVEGGLMKELVTDTHLSFVDDIDYIVDTDELTDESHFYFSNPCYMFASRVNPGYVSRNLRDIEEGYNVEDYIDKITKQIKRATDKYDDFIRDDEEHINKFLSKYSRKNYTKI